jgi:hypothetical protein
MDLPDHEPQAWIAEIEEACEGARTAAYRNSTYSL